MKGEGSYVMERAKSGTGQLFMQRLEVGRQRARLTHALVIDARRSRVQQMTWVELIDYQGESMQRFRALDARDD